MEDKLIAAGKITSGVVSISQPILGLIGAAIFEAISLRAGKRVEALLQMIEARLRALEQTGVLEINELCRRESFLELLVTACEVAKRTHRKEKIERIRNAVVYCALKEPSAAEVDSFFHLLDQLTEEHFIILRVLADHTAAFSKTTKFTEFYERFTGFSTGLPPDAFGHYLYDLKYRRLVRLSPSIEDDDGLTSSTLMTFIGENAGATVVLSEVAVQLLAITAPS